MKITNRTNYNTAGIRKLFSDAMALVKKDYALDWKKVTGLRVSVRYARRGYFVSGHAQYDRGIMQLNIPKKWDAQVAVSRNPNRTGYDGGSLVQALAATFIHELGHNLGVHHTNTDRQPNWKCATIEHHYEAWINGLAPNAYELQAKPASATKEDVRFARFDKAVDNLARAATRLKRAKTLFQKWQTKVNYYERTFPQAAARRKESK